jgi:TonB-dependent starch-binding outer membrane protein SusC
MGAAAAPFTGPTASNGVIIVPPRRGREGAPRVTVSQRLGYYQLSNTLGSRRFTLETALATFAPPPPATGTSADTAAWQADRTRITTLYGDGTHYDHEAQLAGRRALGRETAVGISGGSAGTRYYVSGLVMDEPGIIAGSGFEKHSLRMNLDQQVGHGIELSVNTNLLRTSASRGLTNNDNRSVSYFMALSGTPAFVDLRARDGVFPHNPFAASNPLQTAELLRNDEGVWRFIGSGSARVPVVSGEAHALRLVMSGGADYFQQRNRLVSPPILQFEQLGSDPGTSILCNSDNLHLNGNSNLVHTWSPGAWTATTSLGLQYEDRDLTVARIITVQQELGENP